MFLSLNTFSQKHTQFAHNDAILSNDSDEIFVEFGAGIMSWTLVQPNFTNCDPD
jgi:hypothetical protein